MSSAPHDIRVLLVDDDATFRQVMSAELKRRGYVVDARGSGREALDPAASAEVDVVLLDLRLPDVGGIDVLTQLKGRNIQAGVVVLTGHGTIDTAVKAIRLGAYDYLEKPCPVAKLEMAIQKTFEHVRLLSRQRVLEDGYAAPPVGPAVVGSSPAFRKLMDAVARIARSDSTTLVQGETGVGKELVAKLLHTQGPRCEAPFVAVNCAALHDELFQSEVFGHEKGAFTGAHRLKHGLFEVANGGTLFLDEIGDTSPDAQAKLLRVLETGRFRRLGGTREIEVDVRIVAATNRNLAEVAARGHFREDLYYRLAALTVAIPPLRERQDDIPEFVDHFVGLLNKRFSTRKRIDGTALAYLKQYNWPGNVRELIHVLEQAIVLSEGDLVGVSDLPPAIRAGVGEPPDDGDRVPSLREIQRRHVLSVLDRVGGNRARAAKLLGTSERTFYRLLERHRIGSAPSSRSGDSSTPQA